MKTLHASVTAKDLTLQLCALTHTPMTSTTVFCDVYILHLYGQVANSHRLLVINDPTLNINPASLTDL